MATWRRISVVEFEDEGLSKFVKSQDPSYYKWWGNLNYMLEGDVLIVNIIGGNDTSNSICVSINVRKKQPTTRYKGVKGISERSIQRVCNKSKSRFRKWVKEQTVGATVDCDKCGADIETKKMTGCKNCAYDICESCATPICNTCHGEQKMFPVWWKKLTYVVEHEDVPKDIFTPGYPNIYK